MPRFASYSKTQLGALLRRECWLGLTGALLAIGMLWAMAQSVKDLTSLARYYQRQAKTHGGSSVPDGRRTTGDVLTIIAANVPAGSSVLYWYADDVYDLGASRRLLLRTSYYHPVRFYVGDATRLRTCDYAVMVSAFASDFQRLCAVQGQANTFTQVATTQHHTLFKRIQKPNTPHARGR